MERAIDTERAILDVLVRLQTTAFMPQAEKGRSRKLSGSDSRVGCSGAGASARVRWLRPARSKISSVYLLARLKGELSDGLMVGSARVVLGQERAGFQFPAQDAFDFSLPPGVGDIPVSQWHEVGRLVSERPEGILPGALLTPLGLMQAASLYSRG